MREITIITNKIAQLSEKNKIYSYKNFKEM